jgi:hypothetical protein
MVVSVTKLIAGAAGVLAGSAIAKELDKPPEERTWHGTVAGIPYDFRPPTMEKIRKTVWDPDNPNVLVPHAFGIGWSVNLARLAAPPQPAADQPVAELEPGTPRM